MLINCIIIDDDPAVTVYLKGYIAQIPFLNLLGTFTAPLDGLEALEKLDVQLIFLDIGMPGLNGMELARMLINTKGEAAPRLIFVSGFERFALESYQVNALDYLLKPVTYEDLLRSAYKAKRYFETAPKETGNSHITYTPNDLVFLKVEHDLIKVYMKDILYVESVKDYIKVYLTDGTVHKALSTMKCAEDKLPPASFMRVHRSFMVSLDKIELIHNHTIKIGKVFIPVTEQYKPHLRDYVQRWF